MVKLGKLDRNFPEPSGKKYDVNKYVASVAIATLLLIIGILIGNYFSQQKVSSITQMENDLRLNTISMEIQDTLFSQNPCVFQPSSTESALEDVEFKISMMESQLGKKDSRVLELKKYYSLLEIKHYLLMSTRKSKCAENYSTILFFYSNTDTNLAESEKQGYVLDDLRNLYGLDNLKVYSLDSSLGLDVIGSLMSLYGINQTPSLVVNNATLPGYQEKDKLMSILGK